MSASSRRDRDRRPGRRPPFRDPRPRMLIVCEGRNTEPQYFKQFSAFHRNSLVNVVIAPGQGVHHLTERIIPKPAGQDTACPALL
jgi:hypothetical protein